MSEKTSELLQLSKLQKAKKVLDYWYAIEFLAQDKYDSMWGIRNKMRKAQNDLKKGKLESRSIWSYRELQNSQSIYDVIYTDAESCGMKTWGNITIYIGKIDREICINCISETLLKSDEEDKRPEKTNDSIAWASLQIAPDGTYIEHSLSLSTIIWSMNQIKNNKGNLSESLDEKRYRSAVEAIENKFLSKEEGIKQSEGEGQTAQVTSFNTNKSAGENSSIQEFSPNAVTVSTLKAIYKKIEKDFIKETVQLAESDQKHQKYEEIYGLHFQLFNDELTRNKKDEDNYLGLSHDYFSEDIKLALKKMEEGSLSYGDYMSNDLLRYIVALDENDKNERIDLINPKDKNKFFQQISEILDVGNAPLGKWPSKFMPAFMQQIAVNLCIRKGTSELYGVNGNIFSVNGPPGTGKTTLLKEIVVNNIIERAILLAEYKDPDDAFEKHSFLHGDKQENAYSSYTRGWYSLKNDRINDYSILVTSCNNAAVENISKELPISTGLLNDLKPGPENENEYAKMLNELSALFDPEQSRTSETINKETSRDVYFTDYAKKLFDNDAAWGLVAAPLGRKSNISAFYDQVLNPLYWDFYPTKDFKDARMEKYVQARTEFVRQLQVVEELQGQLKSICALVRKRMELESERDKLELKLSQKSIERNELAENVELRVEKLKTVLDLKIHELKHTAEKRDALLNLISEKEKEISAQSEKKRELLEKEVIARKSTGVLGRLFNRKKAEAGEQLAAEYHVEVVNAEMETVRLEKQVEELRKSLQEAQAAFDQAEHSKTQTDADIVGEETKLGEMESQIYALLARLEKTKSDFQIIETEYSEKVSSNAGLILDVEYMNHLLSEDDKESTAAQAANPWFTKRYNIERMKLFYYAMRLNKEFVLSSKSCRDNFKTLGHYWGKLLGDDKERIAFHREDREKFAGALYQSLFLLVPVLSSTFASLGTCFRDAKQAGVIGTLIVDEAGQAQPQMAVGALYRSRKAMIVGDPKQIEPVVTDDLNLLKRAYDDEELKPYKSKIISVQRFADQINCFGTYLNNGTDYPEWVGCPLLVHRRCISPMYDISNEISYNGIMKQQTREPDSEKAASFVYDKSQWLNVAGREKGNKNHFVEEQAQKVCEILELAFSKSENPSLYIISPFTSVVNEMKDYIKKYKEKNAETNLKNCEVEWMRRNIGTVHTFQGKEANEVVLLLGCDTSREGRNAVQWVSENIVNVAATRAKFRLYVIGDEVAWRDSACVRKAKIILDTFAIKRIKTILETPLAKDEKACALVAASASLPPATSFRAKSPEDEDDRFDYNIDTDSLLYGLDQSFGTDTLTGEQLEKFGFQSMDELKKLPTEVQKNLLLGIKLYYLLSPVYKVNKQLDASCCAILFCKAMELQMRDCFEESLKAVLPNTKIKGQGKGRGRVELKDARTEELTLGVFGVLLKQNSSELGKKMELKGKMEYREEWWSAFQKRLKECTDKRNKCCHAGLFSWMDQACLLAEMFKSAGGDSVAELEGILFASRVGKELR